MLRRNGACERRGAFLGSLGQLTILSVVLESLGWHALGKLILLETLGRLLAAEPVGWHALGRLPAVPARTAVATRTTMPAMATRTTRTTVSAAAARTTVPTRAAIPFRTLKALGRHVLGELARELFVLRRRFFLGGIDGKSIFHLVENAVSHRTFLSGKRTYRALPRRPLPTRRCFQETLRASFTR